MRVRLTGKMTEPCVEFRDSSSLVVYNERGDAIAVIAALSDDRIVVSTVQEPNFAQTVRALGYGKRRTHQGSLANAVQKQSTGEGDVCQGAGG